MVGDHFVDACSLPEESPSSRFVLIGASNLTLSFPLVVDSLRRSLPEPIEIFAAHGHGRSFCHWSYVINRGLPSIPDCGLWEEIVRRPRPKQTFALITDVGNDLIYGRSVESVLKQVDDVFARLSAMEAAITFVRMPLQRILLLTDRRYRIAKKLLFPGPVVPWELMSQRVVELDSQVTALASTYQASVLNPKLDWYSIDPIHIRFSARMRAWREILEAWPLGVPLQMRRPGARFSMNLWRSAPLERTYGSRRYLTPQPSRKLSDGTAVWLY